MALSAELLLRAYAAGLFPMADSADSPEIGWYAPDPRGILPLSGFHVSRSLRQTVRRGTFTIRCDTAFRAVMEACAVATPERPSTWINPLLIEVYTTLHAAGCAHSVECWRDDRLVGGLYGVSLGAAFFGESMFSRETDASKVALVHLVARLQAGGYTLLDTQFVTAHLARFGAITISRAAYQEQLDAAFAAPFPAQDIWNSSPPPTPAVQAHLARLWSGATGGAVQVPSTITEIPRP